MQLSDFELFGILKSHSWEINQNKYHGICYQLLSTCWWTSIIGVTISFYEDWTKINCNGYIFFFFWFLGGAPIRIRPSQSLLSIEVKWTLVDLFMIDSCWIALKFLMSLVMVFMLVQLSSNNLERSKYEKELEDCNKHKLFIFCEPHIPVHFPKYFWKYYSNFHFNMQKLKCYSRTAWQHFIYLLWIVFENHIWRIGPVVYYSCICGVKSQVSSSSSSRSLFSCISEQWGEVQQLNW